MVVLFWYIYGGFIYDAFFVVYSGIFTLDLHDVNKYKIDMKQKEDSFVLPFDNLSKTERNKFLNFL